MARSYSNRLLLSIVILTQLTISCKENVIKKQECDCRTHLSNVYFALYNFSYNDVDTLLIHEIKRTGDTIPHIMVTQIRDTIAVDGYLADSIDLNSTLLLYVNNDGYHKIDSLKLGLLHMPNMFNHEATGDCMLMQYRLDGEFGEGAEISITKN